MSKHTIQTLLQEFQEGYAQRDPALIDSFMDLFVHSDDLEVIGTNAVEPGEGEWCRGPVAVRDLILGDWEHWGDVVFDLAGATIRVHGEVAWIGMTATVADVITADYKYDGFVGFAEKQVLEQFGVCAESVSPALEAGDGVREPELKGAAQAGRAGQHGRVEFLSEPV